MSMIFLWFGSFEYEAKRTHVEFLPLDGISAFVPVTAVGSRVGVTFD